MLCEARSSMETAQLEIEIRPTSREWEELLSRVVESTPFRRSARLRDFLMFVGNEVVLHGATDLHEQQIGVAVFGRPALYDTSQDNIVRVNAMELRKRLDTYFAGEGKHERLLIEIPRGSYCPVFRVRPHVQDESAAELLPPSDEPLTGVNLPPELTLDEPVVKHGSLASLRNPVVVVLLAVVAVLGISLLLSWRRNQQADLLLHRWQSGPAMHSFWGNFFGRKLPPEIVIADTSFGLAQDIMGRQLTLAEYLDYSYRSAQPAAALNHDSAQQQSKDLSVILSRSSGSVGDFRVARRITELQTGDDGTRLVFAREYAGHRLRWNNTIFVGSSRTNPWVELLEDQLAYHFRQAHDGMPSFVIIEHPTKKEQAEYVYSPEPGTKTAYAVIAFLPNPTNTGNTLVVAGTDSQATEAAGDFITSEEDLERLQKLFKRSSFPSFQVLLRVSRSNGTPLRAEVISSRLIDK